MKIHISIQDYMEAWPKQKHTQAGSYYVKLANRLYESILPLRSASCYADKKNGRGEPAGSIIIYTTCRASRSIRDARTMRSEAEVPSDTHQGK